MLLERRVAMAGARLRGDATVVCQRSIQRMVVEVAGSSGATRFGGRDATGKILLKAAG